VELFLDFFDSLVRIVPPLEIVVAVVVVVVFVVFVVDVVVVEIVCNVGAEREGGRLVSVVPPVSALGDKSKPGTLLLLVVPTSTSNNG